KEAARLPVRGADVKSLGFTADGRILVSVTAAAVEVWDVPGRRPHPDRKAWAFRFRPPAAVSPDGMRAAGQWTGSVPRWGAGAGEELPPLAGHARAPTSLAFNADGRTLATADMEGVIRLWDAATGEQHGWLHGHAGEVRTLAFAADGQALASGGADGTVRLWEA